MPWHVNPVCEFVHGGQECGDNTAFAYPAMNIGYMALCGAHAFPHLDYSVSLHQLALEATSVPAGNKNQGETLEKPGDTIT